jgi:hypothetical protein
LVSVKDDRRDLAGEPGVLDLVGAGRRTGPVTGWNSVIFVLGILRFTTEDGGDAVAQNAGLVRII